MKTKVHIIHHTHWDMEWYFTTHDTNSLLNYSLNDALENLEKKDEVFLFDGQIAPFEDVVKDPTLFSKIKKLVRNGKLKIGPWYSQPDLRLTSDEGIQRNFHYGQNLNGLKSNKFSYIYTPDTFGFAENIPSIYENFKNKYTILWRGVNRKVLNNAPIFKWEDNSGASTIVYNIGAGYFVGRYLKDDKNFENLYQNSILPSIERQSQKGKYSVVAIPSGGDQQPYNSDLKNAIKRLNSKNDGNEYILSSWEAFFKELGPQIKNIPKYKGSHTLAYGGRLHKMVGANRADIKKLIYKTEMQISRVLEPMLLMSSLSKKYYPEFEIDKMWKNILLSQAHDAYASCNSDQVNTNIKNRLLDSKNIYESSKDMILRFISNEYSNNSLLIFNPTQFGGEKVFLATIATRTKHFNIKNRNNFLDYVIVSQKKIKGGVHVTYNADGEYEEKLPDIYISKIKFISKVSKMKIKKLKVVEIKKQNQSSHLDWNVSYKNGLFHLKNKQNKSSMGINFHMDAGDSYDPDIHDDVSPLTLKFSNMKKVSQVTSGKLSVINYEFSLNLPKNIYNWKKKIFDQKLKGRIQFTISNRLTINYSFTNLTKNLLIQPIFNKYHSIDDHTVLTHNGYISRKNSMKIDKLEFKKLRELPSDFDFMHGNVILGDKQKLSLSSLDFREYKISENKILFNLLRTPDVLGRHNLKIRPGRASGLSDKEVKTPKSTSELNGEKFGITLGFNFNNNELANIVNELVIDDLVIHKQNLYKYYSNVNNWTLPDLKTEKNFLNSLHVSNKNMVIQAFFKSRGYYYLRVNNPFNQIINTDIKIFDKEFKNVIIKSNESKTIKFK